MTKEAYYFSHDANAQHDPKVLKMLSKHGWEGYGIYWALVERLRNEPTYILECDYDCIAFALRTTPDIIQTIVLEYGLFEVYDGNFWSDSLMERMKMKDERSQKARESALKRWKPSANGLRMNSEPNAIKEKKRKKKKIKYNYEFSEFWNLYNKKIGDKNRCEKAWYSLTDRDRMLIIETLPDFIKQFSESQFQPYPATYLNQHRWEDEYVVSSVNKSDFKRDTLDSAYIGYCEKCNKSDFYKTVNEDSRCCQSNILPNKHKMN